MMENNFWNIRTCVQDKAPIVHSITNDVVMNTTANILLAVGASPIMAHALDEMEEMVSISSALVINIGTLDEYKVESMKSAIEAAKKLHTPWILDPVGIGASQYRKEMVSEILSIGNPTVIRGNASEIMALGSYQEKGRGVDSTRSSLEAVEIAKSLCEKYNCIVSISGAIDFVVEKDCILSFSNGSDLMPKVTGTGCSLTALTGAFVACSNNPFLGAASAVAYMGVCGEIATQKSFGPGTLQSNLLDVLYNMDEMTFIKTLKFQQIV